MSRRAGDAIGAAVGVSCSWYSVGLGPGVLVAAGGRVAGGGRGSGAGEGCGSGAGGGGASGAGGGGAIRVHFSRTSRCRELSFCLPKPEGGIAGELQPLRLRQQGPQAPADLHGE